MIDTNRMTDAPYTDTRYVRYDPANDIGVSSTLVVAIADIAGVDPLELDPLNETLDPEMLDDFVESGGSPNVDGRISFTFEGFDVTVHESGLLAIEPADD